MNELSTTTLSAVMLLAGIGIPVMAALNSGLGVRLGNPVLAANVLFLVAFASSLVVLVINPDPLKLEFAGIAPRYFLGGLLVAFYVLSVTFVTPRLGVGNAIVLVLLGQLIAAALIDHFALFGAPQSPLTGWRALGIVFMIAGVALARRSVF
jgi:transporter family-2 protein